LQFRIVDGDARRRIQALEIQGVQRDCEIADLSGRLSRLAATLVAIRAEAERSGREGRSQRLLALAIRRPYPRTLPRPWPFRQFPQASLR
jgi:hypothetical protein